MSWTGLNRNAKKVRSLIQLKSRGSLLLWNHLRPDLKPIVLLNRKLRKCFNVSVEITQPADEPTKIQTASGLVKIERKTLSSDVSVSEDAKESSPAPKPTLVQASKPKAKPVQAGKKDRRILSTRVRGESIDEGTGGGNGIVIANLDLEDLQNYHLKILRN